MTRAEYQAKYGSEPFAGAAAVAAQPPRSFLDRAIDFSLNLPTAPLGEAIGRSVQAFGALAKGDTQTFRTLADQNAANMGKVVGSAAYSAVAPASFAISGAPTVLGTALKLGAAGAVQSGTASVAQGSTAGQVVKDTAVGAALGAAVGGAVKLFGNLLQKSGEKITTSVIRPSTADVADGFSIDTIQKYDLGGTLRQSLEKTDTLMDDLSRQLNTKLSASNATVNLSQTYEATARKLLGNKFENFGSNASMERALESLRTEVVSSAGVNGLVSVPEAQTIKRAAGHLGAWLYKSPDPDANTKEKVYTAFYQTLKKQIEENAPEGVREINKQLSELIPVMNAIVRRIPVADRNNVLSLTDIISLTGATFEPSALGLTLVNLASKSGRVGNALMKGGAATTGVIPANVATNLNAMSPQSQTGSDTEAISTSPQFTPEKEAAIRQGFELGTATAGGVGGVAKAAGQKLANIHPDDLRVLQRFVDAVRLRKGEMSDALFDSAEKLAQKFGISMDVGLNRLANTFDDILAGTRDAADTVVQARDALGRFK